MNWLKRLFKKEIAGDELSKLLLSLGKDKKFIQNLNEHAINGYSTIPFAYLDVKKENGGLYLEMEINKKYFHRGPVEKGGRFYNDDIIYSDSPPISFKKIISYDELNKNPVLKKYIKGKNLEKSLAVLSIGSILASTFFISNNITGNAILTNTAESSGFIGAGLFVLGLVSFILARNI